jgi:hypothetical protein
MTNNGQVDAAVPSELNVLLDLYPNEGDRNAILKAYYGLAHGDPNTFPMQFAVLLTAHAQALKAYQRPDLDIQKAQVDVSRLIVAVDKLAARCEGISQTIAIVESLTRKRLHWAMGSRSEPAYSSCLCSMFLSDGYTGSSTE